MKTTPTRRSKLASYAVAGVLGLLTVGAVVARPTVSLVQAQANARHNVEQAEALTRVVSAKQHATPTLTGEADGRPAPTARA